MPACCCSVGRDVTLACGCGAGECGTALACTCGVPGRAIVPACGAGVC
jgi:hypothetical protein